MSTPQISNKQPLAIGQRVRIVYSGEMHGTLGTIYNHVPSRPAPWHVRPDGWPLDMAGIAYKEDELECIEVQQEQQ